MLAAVLAAAATASAVPAANTISPLTVPGRLAKPPPADVVGGIVQIAIRINLRTGR